MLKFVTPIGIVASWSVWLLGNLIWVESEIGAATGSAIFTWLWLPGLSHSIFFLIQKARLGGLRLTGLLASTANLGLATSLCIYNWGEAPYLIQLAEAHSGVQLGRIESFLLQPPFFAATAAIVIGSLSILVSSWYLPPRVQSKLVRTQPEADAGRSDPRSIWDEQSHE